MIYLWDVWKAPTLPRLNRSPDLAGKPEFRRQTVGGCANDPRPLLQRLDRQAPDRARNADGADGLPAEIANRHRGAAYFGVELAVVDGKTGAPHFGDFTPQGFSRRDRLRRKCLEVGARQIALELIDRQGCQHDLAESRAVRGTHRAGAIVELE